MKFLVTSFIALSLLCTEVMTQPTIWGVTSNGSSSSSGTIFSTDIEGENLSSNYIFLKDGHEPQFTKLCKANGKLYGVTPKGGKGSGVIFEYDPVTFEYTVKHVFEGLGIGPVSSLIFADNGSLYGTTVDGGEHGYGILFEYNLSTETFITKFHFRGAFYQPESYIGGSPWGGVIQASNGKLYGTCETGQHLRSTLFEYDIATSTYTVKVTFDLETQGSSSKASLVEAPNGKLYGLCNLGGVHGGGTLFEYDPVSGICIKKIDFNIIDGYYLQTGLTLGHDGKLYGTAWGGGILDNGVMFSYDPVTELLETKINFDGTTGGSRPIGSLEQASNGKLYGMTSKGGSNGRGILYEYDILSGLFTKKMDLDGINSGSNPECSLLEIEPNVLYGMTTKGGNDNFGILFKYDIGLNVHEKKRDFLLGTEGVLPNKGLLFSNNRMIYGTTSDGGLYGNGVLFEYDPVLKTYQKKIDFDGVSNGSLPCGGLIQASNGLIYGTTKRGGSTDFGCIFEYDPGTGILTKKADFNTLNGLGPNSGLVQADNGKLYGTTVGGGELGIFGAGVLFEYDILLETINVKVEFNGTEKGRNPLGDLVLSENGKLYGLTTAGGEDNFGVIYEYDIATDAYLKKMDFDGSISGSSPRAGLIQGRNNKLYGMTYEGGENDLGVMFEYDPELNMYVKRIDFSGVSNGRNPEGKLLYASNDMIYGTTSRGGNNGYGVLFQFDLLTNTFIKKQDFNFDKGVYPVSDLIEVDCLHSESPSNETILSNLRICAGDSTELSGAGSEIINWYSESEGGEYLGSGLNFTTPVLNQNATFYIEDSLCWQYNERTPITVVVNAIPSITINASSTIICSGDSIVLTATGGSTYFWSNGVTNGVPFYPLETATYSVLGSDDNNCSNTALQTIEVLDSKNYSQTIELCFGESYSIGTNTYTLNGNYSDVLVASNGCDSIVETTLIVKDSIDVSLNLSDQLISANQVDANYQWINCDMDTVIEGETSRFYNATVEGNYAVVISFNNCVDTSECLNVMSVEVSSINSSKPQASIYPNPSYGTFVITSHEQLGKVMVQNSFGKIVYFNEVSSSKMELNLEGEASGIYFITITSNTLTEKYKVVISRK